MFSKNKSKERSKQKREKEISMMELCDKAKNDISECENKLGFILWCQKRNNKEDDKELKAAKEILQNLFNDSSITRDGFVTLQKVSQRVGVLKNFMTPKPSEPKILRIFGKRQ